MALTIRAEPFDHPDAVLLRAEHEADLIERYGGDVEPGKKPVAAETPVFLVARDEGGLLGCGALRPLDAQTVEMKRMYVRPEARRKGVGLALVAALEQAARELGATRVVLETGTRQHEAMALYEGAGYRPIPCFGAYASSAWSRCFGRSL
jgi:GNAT superfamily N-acetyltransferase